MTRVGVESLRLIPSSSVRGGLNVRPFILFQDLVRGALQTIQTALLDVLIAVMYVS